MSYLLDTNILLRFVSPEDSMHLETVNAVDSLNANRERLIIAPQNLIEFWNVCTRPSDKNGLGFTPEIARTEIDRFKRLFVLLSDTERVYSEWERLVTTYEVKGTKVHDTRLVAFMLVHQISHILTFNVKDFRRFQSEVTAVSPRQMNDLDK